MSVKLPEPEKKIDETQATAPAHTLNADECKEVAKPHVREKLAAEKKFDQWVYGGISYAAQAATGIVVARWLRDGAGKPIFDKMANWTGKNFISKISSKTGAAAAQEANHWIVVTTMINVGNLFLVPVKMLENRKPEIVREMTEKDNAKRIARGETISPEEKAKQEELLDQLDHAPKQSWMSLLLGRAFGLGAVYATVAGVGEKNNSAMESVMADGMKTAAKSVGLKKLAESPALDSYSRIAFNDFFYSIVSSGGLYVYSHFLHPHQVKNDVVKDKLPKECAEPAPAAAAPEVPAALPAPTRSEAVVTEPLAETKHADKEDAKRESSVTVAAKEQPKAYTEKVQRDASHANNYSMSV